MVYAAGGDNLGQAQLAGPLRAQLPGGYRGIVGLVVKAVAEGGELRIESCEKFGVG